MRFKGTCIAVEDSSYQSKRSGWVGQRTLTCVDADLESRLRSTVDVVLPEEEFERIKEHPIDKTFDFEVFEIRPGRDPRFRFGCLVSSFKMIFNDGSTRSPHIDPPVLAAVWDTFTFKDEVMPSKDR